MAAGGDIGIDNSQKMLERPRIAVPSVDFEAKAFDMEYSKAIAVAYPNDNDGVTLFPFRRFFLVAQR